VGDQVTVGLQPVHPPALDPAGADRDRVRVDDGLLPERVLEVDDLEERAAVVDVRSEPRRRHALDPEPVRAVTVDRRLIRRALGLHVELVHQPPVAEKCW
jgi:hypothetical protein